MNWLAIQVPWLQANNSSDIIGPSATETPTDRRVTHLINLARQAGMRVFLNPFINSEVGNGWQALFHPANVAVWFQSYDAYVAHYAKLAPADHVDLFAIGDEFDWMDRVAASAPYWDEAIATVRQYYSGPVTCGANSTNHPTVTFWNKLDEVGRRRQLPAVFVGKPYAGVPRGGLESGSGPAGGREGVIRAQRQAGSYHRAWLLRASLGRVQPGWVGTRPTGRSALQNELCQATLQTIRQCPQLQGIMWVWWTNPLSPNWQGGPSDIGYTLHNTPAEATLRQYFS
ncbi:MAG: glycoside hydrolase family 113 [Clostridia bacterium]